MISLKRNSIIVAAFLQLYLVGTTVGGKLNDSYHILHSLGVINMFVYAASKYADYVFKTILYT